MYAIFTTEQDAIQAEAYVHRWLTENRPGYNAERWAHVQKHPTLDLWEFPLPPESVDLSGFGVEVTEALTAGWYPDDGSEI